MINNDHPETVNYKRRKGEFKGYDRIAIGGYRVVFRFIRGIGVIVDTVKAGPRGDIY